jgi:uncharacterized repeat protein (TIGR03803 family)
LNDSYGYDINGKLLEASDGKLYGATAWGGPHGSGSLFRLNKDGNNLEIIYDFPDFANGYSPTGSLVEDANGILYGTTLYGYPGTGVIFKINKDGSGYTPLKNFTVSDPALPYGGLRLYQGFLYGIGYYGTNSGYGGIFRIRTDGTGYELLHSFSLSTDGGSPMSVPVISAGKLYGTTTYGGTDNLGTIYSMDVSGNNFLVL